MTQDAAEPPYLTLAIPAGPLFGNTPFVEHQGNVYVCIPTPSARGELAAAPAVVVTIGAGRPKVPADRDEAERDTLTDMPARRAKLVPVGGRWMRVDWLPEEPPPAAGLVEAARRYAFGRR